MKARVAINGFGRIGRQFLKASLERHPEVEIVALNDLADPKMNAHLFKHDSNYGRYQGDVSATADSLVVDGRTIKVLQERDPAKLPWKALDVDIVVESTGFFTDATKAKAHIDAGAKYVIISAPAKNEDKTIVLGVNAAFKRASEGPLKGIMDYTEEPLVSSDLKGDAHSTIVSGLDTIALGNMVKVISWYDNEWGYACRLADITEFVASKMRVPVTAGR